MMRFIHGRHIAQFMTHGSAKVSAGHLFLEAE